MSLYKRRKFKPASLLFIMMIIVYVPSLFNWLYGDRIETELVRVGVIEDSVNTDAYVIRDEHIIKAPFSGIYLPRYEDGDRAAAGAIIASVVKNTALQYMEELKELDLKILKSRMEKKINTEIFSGDIIKLDGEIEENIYGIIENINNNSLKETGTLIDDLNDLLAKKTDIITTGGSADTYIENLKNERESLSQKIQLNREEVYNTVPGIISHSIDGWEEIISPQALQNIRPDQLKEAQNLTPLDDSIINITEKDRPFIKTVTGIEYYIAIIMNDRIQKFMKDVDASSPSFEGLQIAINVLEKKGYVKEFFILDPEGEGKILFLKMERFLEDTLDMRVINIDIIKSYHSGLKVYLKSLIDYDRDNMTAKIALVKGNYVTIRKVDITGANDKFAIVLEPGLYDQAGVSLYDTYVVNPVNIKEGQVIR